MLIFSGMREAKIAFKFAAIAFGALIASQIQAGQAKVEAAIAVDQDTKPTTSFSSNVPKLYAFFRTKGTHDGDKLRGVWIAEDVGDAAPANTKIDEATLTADQDDFFGAFSLTKPTKGWPAGKYRVEIYDGDELATSVKFTIKAGKSKDESEDDSSQQSDD